MMMNPVITYTPNPAIDVWAQCERVILTEKTRIENVRTDPGGGGINVTRVLIELGLDSLPIYLAGGATGTLFQTMLEQRGIKGLCIPIAGDTRISEVVFETQHAHAYRFVADGPIVKQSEADQALATIAQTRGDWLVASGSLPRGLPDDHYLRVAQLAHSNNMKVALDCSGAALKSAGLEGQLDLLKISKRELSELVDQPVDDVDQLAKIAMQLINSGRIKRLLVSMGPDGACLADQDGITLVPAQKINIKSTVGAGDSFLGGFLYGLVTGADDKQALAMAIAAGSAACIRPGTQLVSKDEFDAFHQAPSA
jgi:6-phosphofructokinase 2